MRTPPFAITVLILAVTGCRRAGPPFSPAESIQRLRLEPGYGIEVFAAEPGVVGPVDMEFDEFGRVDMVEDRGYPLDTRSRPGRVKLLQDTNGDGRPAVSAAGLVMRGDHGLRRDRGRRQRRFLPSCCLPTSSC